jgi:xylulokinase
VGKPYCIVYDVGTSSLKGVIYDRSGAVIAKKSRFYEFSALQEGWAEIDPEVWWESLLRVTDELTDEFGPLESIEGAAVTGQMHSAVLLGEDDKPVSPSILWLDRRAAAETAELQKRFGLPPYKLNSSYTLPKLYWQAKHQRQIMERVRTILWPKDYLRMRLTGCKVTDYTEGIGSSLIDWETWTWAAERIEACGLSETVLPPILPQGQTVPMAADAAQRLGFKTGCPVLIGSGDIAALLGGAPNRPGRLVYSLGSSSMYFTELTGPPLESGGLYTLDISGYRLFGGVSSTTGAALNWAYEQLWGGEKALPFSTMIEKVLSETRPGESLLFFPFLAGERSPFWSDSISGSFEGLKLHHTRSHLTRAVMEGVAMSIRYVLDLMEQSAVDIDEIALAGGGAKTPGWPGIIAAVTAKPVAVYNAEETVTTVLFAQLAASLTGENFREVLSRQFSQLRMVLPESGLAESYRRLYSRYKRYLEVKVPMYESSAEGERDEER